MPDAPTDFRARDAAPFSPEERLSIDLGAQDSARSRLVGRRFLSLYGPLGAGVEYIAADRLTAPQGAVVSLLGDAEAGAPATAGRPPASPAPAGTPLASLEMKAALEGNGAQAPLGSARRSALPLPLIYRDAV